MALSDRMVVLNRGNVEQIGPPEDVYHRPASEFVAGFVGDPPMSLLDVEYADDQGKPGFRVVEQDAWLPADGEMAMEMRRRPAGGTVRLGFRASEVTVQSEQDKRHSIPGEIYVVEIHGHRSLLTVKIGKNLTQVASPAESLWRVKDVAWLGLDASNLHLFVDGVGVVHPALRTVSGPLP
jgi:ABC-type sugar transport system ATPase subunit